MPRTDVAQLRYRCTFALLLAAVFAPRSEAIVIDFEDVAPAQIIDDEYLPELVVFAVGGADLAVIYDTQNPDGSPAGGADDDLEPNPPGPPFTYAGGNAANQGFNNVLIIQTGSGPDPNPDGDNFIDVPPNDDAGGGELFLTFQFPLASFGFSKLDLDDGGGGGNPTDTSAIVFYDGSFDVADEVARFTFRELETRNLPAGVDFANDHANVVAPFTPAELGGAFDRVLFDMTGSGAFDEFDFVFVPEPTSGALIGLAGLGGLAPWILRRLRRKSA